MTKIVQHKGNFLPRVGMTAAAVLFAAGVVLASPRMAAAQFDIPDFGGMNTDFGMDSLGSGGNGHMTEVSDPSGVTVTTMPCVPPTTYPGTVVLCHGIGQTEILTELMIYPLFESGIKKVSGKLEEYLYSSIDSLVYGGLQSIDATEKKMIEWWKTMWTFNMRPSMQLMTEQLGTAIAEQTKEIMSADDAQMVNETNAEMQQTEAADATNMAPDENGCSTATVVGGLGRAATISKAMQKAMQDQSQAAGINKKGTPGARGRAAWNAHRAENYERYFCDPSSNGGQDTCAAGTPNPNPFANADTQFTKYISNKLTIPVSSAADGEALKVAVTTGIDNLVGSPAADPILPGGASKSAAQEQTMARRAMLARNAAARAVPSVMAGNRMPGSKMAEWVNEIQTASGMPSGDLSENPSYREVIHAVTVGRFNSGKYAFGSISDRNKVEMEKLRLATFNLILLRDYYELLERTALTLAVQVAVMSDQIKVLDPNSAMPTRKQ